MEIEGELVSLGDKIFAKCESFESVAIELDYYRPQFALELILPKPRLQKVALTVNSNTGFSLNQILKENLQYSTIKSLELKNSSVTIMTPYFNIMTIRAFPNLEHLKITKLDNRHANFIADTCKSLKKLEVDSFGAQKIDDKEFYLNLDEFYIVKVERSSQKLFGELNKKRLNNLKRICRDCEPASLFAKILLREWKPKPSRLQNSITLECSCIDRVFQDF